MRRGNWMMAALAIVTALALVGPAVADKYKGFERGDALITVKELKQLMDKKDPKLVILAVAKPVKQYRTGHIPGSINIWRPDYEPKVGEPYPFDGMLINRAEFQAFARKLGIDNDSKVVVYDHKYDATRVWWAFYNFGKTDVRVLDGGMPAWKEAGYDTDIFAPDAPKPGNFVASMPKGGWIAQMSDIWRGKTDADVQLWDTREKDEWSGAKKKGNAKRAGRIPWAEFQSWKEFRVKVGDKPTGFKNAAEIQKVIDSFKMDKNKDQIFYCQSGVRTTTGIFALYLMGWDLDRLHNYDGSWLEWSYHADNPLTVDKK